MNNRQSPIQNKLYMRTPEAKRRRAIRRFPMLADYISRYHENESSSATETAENITPLTTPEQEAVAYEDIANTALNSVLSGTQPLEEMLHQVSIASLYYIKAMTSLAAAKKGIKLSICDKYISTLLIQIEKAHPDKQAECMSHLQSFMTPEFIQYVNELQVVQAKNKFLNYIAIYNSLMRSNAIAQCHEWIRIGEVCLAKADSASLHNNYFSPPEGERLIFLNEANSYFSSACQKLEHMNYDVPLDVYMNMIIINTRLANLHKNADIANRHASSMRRFISERNLIPRVVKITDEEKKGRYVTLLLNLMNPADQTVQAKHEDDITPPISYSSLTQPRVSSLGLYATTPSIQAGSEPASLTPEKGEYDLREEPNEGRCELM